MVEFFGRRNFLIILSLLSLFLCVSACGGGSGKRNSSLRVLHGAIQFPPLSVRGLSEEGELKVLQTVHYADASQYVNIKDGEQAIVIERANAPEIVYQTFAQEFKKNVGYLIFAYEHNGSLNFKLIEESFNKPNTDTVGVRFLNATTDIGSVSVRESSTRFGNVAEGEISDLIAVLPGSHSFTFVSSEGSVVSSTGAVSLVNGSDNVYFLVSGSKRFDTFFLTRFF